MSYTQLSFARTREVCLAPWRASHQPHPPLCHIRHARLLLALLVAVTGGRNGYGAKLANIFSSEFTIETADGACTGGFGLPAAVGHAVRFCPVICAFALTALAMKVLPHAR